RRLDLPEGTFYVGYPVVATQDDTLTFDALLTTESHGVVAFDLLSTDSPILDSAAWEQIANRQLSLFLALKAKLLTNPALVAKRDLAVPINIVTYSSHRFFAPADLDISPASPGTLHEVLSRMEAPLTADRYKALNAAIQRVTHIRSP